MEEMNKEPDLQNEDDLQKEGSGEAAETVNAEDNTAGAGEQAETEAAEAEAEDIADGEYEPLQEEKPEKKGFFKKKKDKRDEQIEDLNDRLKRLMAEFDNYRKRTDKEKASMFEMGSKDVIEKILPVVDNFERGLAAAGEDKKEDPFVKGMDKIYRQLMTTLEGMDVKPIEAKGQPFDPNLHNAVMHVEDEEAGENIVVEEFQKGYTYRDHVVRHSMVKVAN